MYNNLNLDPDKYEFVSVASELDVPAGKRLFVDIEGQLIVIFNIAGEYFAIADICSHDEGPLGDGDLEEKEIICPRHGARFDIRTGRALALPAVVDIPAYPVRVIDGQIQIGLHSQ